MDLAAVPEVCAHILNEKGGKYKKNDFRKSLMTTFVSGQIQKICNSDSKLEALIPEGLWVTRVHSGNE